MAGKITRFHESEINKKIKSKVTSTKHRKRGPHSTLGIFLNEKLVGKVKIPNAHPRLFSEKKSERVAQALRLTFEEYDNLIECNLTGGDYFKILEKRLQPTT